MFASAWAWIVSHKEPIAAVVFGLFVIAEFILPRTKWVKANSIVEAIFNVFKPVLLPIPLVGRIAAFLATPEVKAIEDAIGSAIKPAPRGPSAALMLFFLSAFMALPGCTPAQSAAWKAVGSAVEKACLMPGASAAFTDLIDQANQPGVTIESAAIAIGMKDGIPAALCVAEQFLAHLDQLAHAEQSPAAARAAQIAQWIVEHRAEYPARVEVAKRAAHP